jgi:type II secretory pathway pseudopilin PulG
MRAQKTQSGYTIIETLIVLAVTAAMFVVTVILVSGQIARYQFRSGVLNTQQSVQSVLNDVQTGYFNLADSTTAACNSGSNSDPGDSDCVYVGKRITISNTGALSAYPLIADIDTNSPIGQPVANMIEINSPEVTNLSGSIDYSNPASGDIYVLYTNYPNGSTANFNGGAQAVGVFGRDGSGNIAQLPTGKLICMQNGTRKAVLKIGVNGAMNVDVSYQPTVAECP